jgi:hypothetical protein
LTPENEVVNVATPFTRGAVPMKYLVWRKVTDPVGVGPDFGVTVAVNVTACPNVDGFSEDWTAVDVTIAFGKIV